MQGELFCAHAGNLNERSCVVGACLRDGFLVELTIRSDGYGGVCGSDATSEENLSGAGEWAV